MPNRTERNFTKCPKCSIFTIRDGGCDHITCKNCKFEYCFKCLKPSTAQRCRYGKEDPDGHGPPVTLDDFLKELYENKNEYKPLYNFAYDKDDEKDYDNEKYITLMDLNQYNSYLKSYKLKSNK